jgi:hypothetical protein
MHPTKFLQYKEEIQLLKEKYFNKMEILYGFEADFLPPISYPDYSYYKDFDPDYLIGSVHFVWNHDCPQNGTMTVDDETEKVKNGIEKVDVLQFDTELKTKEPVPFKKAKKEIKIIGRGGTDFQPVADYYCTHPEYDGLIYFTDGIAPIPNFNTKRNINVLWILTSKDSYNNNINWIKKLARNRATFIPGI